MPNYWMLVCFTENFLVTRERGFTMQGFSANQRRKVRLMQHGDRLLYYLSDAQAFPATATGVSGYREDHTPVWVGRNPREDYPLRVDIRPEVVLKEGQWVDARQLGPSLEYVRKWPPEQWPLAFLEELHLLSQRDFYLLEEETRKISAKAGANPVGPPGARPPPSR